MRLLHSSDLQLVLERSDISRVVLLLVTSKGCQILIPKEVFSEKPLNATFVSQ